MHFPGFSNISRNVLRTLQSNVTIPRQSSTLLHVPLDTYSYSASMKMDG